MRYTLAVVALTALAAGPGCKRKATLTPLEEAARESSARVPVTPSPLACPGFGAPQDVGTLQIRELTEASGLVVSHRNAGVLFGHNDSGDIARVFAMSQTGHPLGVYTLASTRATDWEDITEGPAPNREGSYLYIADTGDNRSVRPYVTVYRVAEPEVSVGQAFARVDIAATNVEAFEIHYPDHAHDAETLLVDPVTADVVVVTKEREGPSMIFTAPPLRKPGDSVTLTKVGTLNFGKTFISGRLATSGDVTPSGDAVAIRTYSDAWLYPRAPGTQLWEALTKTPCALPLALEPQGEAIAFTATGDGYYTLSEGKNAVIHYVPRTAPPVVTLAAPEADGGLPRE